MACGILVPRPGIEPKSMMVKAQVFTIGPPGNSLELKKFKATFKFQRLT